MDLFNLNRFLSAQDNFNTYETALAEVREGSKRSHWIWYIFPQIHGLGHSSTSKRYSIKSLLEAKAYLEDGQLKDRLYEVSKALMGQDDTANNIFGGLDAMKVRSCMTLFDIVSPDDIFAEVLEKFFGNKRCGRTLEIVQKELEYYKTDSAFERNGIHAPEKAFLEAGSEESKRFSEEETIGTLLELFSRGESMTSIVSRYLWCKDMSEYRTSGIESSTRQYYGTIVNKLCELSSDEALVKEALDLDNKLCQDDMNVLLTAKAFDDFYKEHRNHVDMAEVIKYFIKHSKCMALDTTGKRFYNNIERPYFTPNKLSVLKDDEIFVFGSNLAGMHGGGAARAAKLRFGAIMGQGVGLQGQSYAIPTMQGGVSTIKPYTDQFIDFARSHSDLFFYVTRIGCGIAGFKDEDIAPLFKNALNLENVCLPESFVKVLKTRKPTNFPQISRLASHRLYQQGQVRTLADIAKVLNDKYHFTNVDDFYSHFFEVVRKYEERGTVSYEVCDVIGNMIRDNENELFPNGGFLEFDKFIRMVDGLSYVNEDNPLDVIYSRREKTKMLRLAAMLNDIMHYTSAQNLFYDLCATASGRFNCGDNRFMNDSFRYPLHFFKWGIKELWDDIQKDGYMNNELLEEKMFTEHERKVMKYGLATVIQQDFVQDSICHPEVYVPKRIGTAPIYVKDSFYEDHCTGEPKFVKSCGEGKGPNAHETAYETHTIMHILRRECYSGEYQEVNDYFIPVKDISKPIFHKWHGVIRFEVERDKLNFLYSLRHSKG